MPRSGRNPPLSPSVLRLIVALAVAFVNVAFGLTLMLHGAWPVTPFMGADVLLLAWAFRASSIAARRHERITLRPTRLTVEHHPAERNTQPDRVQPLLGARPSGRAGGTLEPADPEKPWPGGAGGLVPGASGPPILRRVTLKAALRKNRETALPS